MQVRLLADWLLLLDPAADVTPAGLQAVSKCYDCFEYQEVRGVSTGGSMIAAQSQLIAEITAIFSPATDVSPQGLMNIAACFDCLSPWNLQVFIACELAAAVQPFPPMSPFPIYKDSAADLQANAYFYNGLACWLVSWAPLVAGQPGDGFGGWYHYDSTYAAAVPPVVVPPGDINHIRPNGVVVGAWIKDQ